MFPEMLGEIAFVDAGVIASGTFELLFSGVNSLVGFHVPLFPEFLGAKAARVVFPLLVNGPLMAEKTATIGESHRARIAKVIPTTLGMIGK